MKIVNCKLDFQSSLENLYISPLESCNLNCKHCYTTKTKNILTNTQILDFIRRYQNYLPKFRSHVFLKALNVTHSQRTKKYDEKLKLKSILFCGGEVFTLPDFPQLVNQLLSQNIFITIITNGTIDRLSEISDPINCQLIVSFDGPRDIHDANRGAGNFDKSVKFVTHALHLGFPVEIFYLVTADSYPYIDQFNLFDLKITYLIDRLGSLTKPQTLNLLRHYPTYPSKHFGCFQLALQSDGHIYGCCESSIPLASISDPIDKIITTFRQSLNICAQCHAANNFSNCGIAKNDAAMFFFARNHVSEAPTREHGKKSLRVVKQCHGCCQPDFLCGFIKQLNASSCQSVVKLL